MNGTKQELLHPIGMKRGAKVGFNRRSTLIGAAALAAMVLYTGHAWSQGATNYPNRAVKLVVPFTPGGFPDVVARIVAEQLQKSMGQPFVVENLPGAGGIAASEAVAKSNPDGYTLLVADNQQWGITPAVYKKLPYDPVKDLVPVSLLSTTPIFVAVNSKVPAKTMGELIALVKANPEKYDYATPGVASAHHLIMETIKSQTGMKIEHIPYKGGGLVAPALANGEIMIAMSALSNIRPFLKDGSARLLAVSTPKRSPNEPEVPTFAELGMSYAEFTGALGIMAPAKTPPDIVNKLANALAAAIKAPASAERLTKSGFDAVGGDPATFEVLIKSDIDKLEKAARLARIEKQ